MRSATERTDPGRAPRGSRPWLAALLLLAACGETERPEEPVPRVPPPASGDSLTDSLTDSQREGLEQLAELGYASGVEEAGPVHGVTVHERDRVWPGRNFYVSAHGPEAVLMDMEGTVLHTWERDFWDIWPASLAKRNDPNTRYFRRAWPVANGDLIVIFEGLGVARLDRDSRVLWSNDCNAHHDAALLPDGDLWVLSRYWQEAPRDGRQVKVLLDVFTLLDPRGKLKRQVSLLDCILRSDWPELWTESLVADGDVFHTNTLEILDGRLETELPAFAAGNALVSIRNQNALAVVDLEQRRLTWMRKGGWAHQHDPRLLDDGRILFFDNLGLGEERSRVLELEPASGEVAWSWSGSDEDPLFSHRCGTAQRLPNGNTLVTESGPGRAVEVTREGRIVWEFMNPGRAANKPKLRARIFDLQRLAPDFGDGWVATPGGER